MYVYAKQNQVGLLNQKKKLQRNTKTGYLRCEANISLQWRIFIFDIDILIDWLEVIVDFVNILPIL